MIRRMRGIIIVLLIALAFIGWWMASSYSGVELDSSTSTLSLAPDFTWRTFDGKAHTFKELSGHVVVIHFWASWCAPCREEFPELLRTAAKLGDKVIFLTLSGDEDIATAQEFINNVLATNKIKTPANVLYGFDPKKTITFDIFQTIQYPESIALDSKQHMRRKFPGVVDWDDKQIEEYLRRLP